MISSKSNSSTWKITNSELDYPKLIPQNKIFATESTILVFVTGNSTGFAIKKYQQTCFLDWHRRIRFQICNYTGRCFKCQDVGGIFQDNKPMGNAVWKINNGINTDVQTPVIRFIEEVQKRLESEHGAVGSQY